MSQGDLHEERFKYKFSITTNPSANEAWADSIEGAIAAALQLWQDDLEAGLQVTEITIRINEYQAEDIKIDIRPRPVRYGGHSIGEPTKEE